MAGLRIHKDIGRQGVRKDIEAIDSPLEVGCTTGLRTAYQTLVLSFRP